MNLLLIIIIITIIIINIHEVLNSKEISIHQLTDIINQNIERTNYFYKKTQNKKFIHFSVDRKSPIRTTINSNNNRVLSVSGKLRCSRCNDELGKSEFDDSLFYLNFDF
jgi:hypothetical protein